MGEGLGQEKPGKGIQAETMVSNRMVRLRLRDAVKSGDTTPVDLSTNWIQVLRASHTKRSVSGEAEGTCRADTQDNTWSRFTGEDGVCSARRTSGGVCIRWLETDSDLRREAEDGHCFGKHSHGGVDPPTGVSTITSRELGESKEQRALQGWPEMGETGQETEKEQKGEETIKL